MTADSFSRDERPTATDIAHSSAFTPKIARSSVSEFWTVLICDDQQTLRDAIGAVLSGAERLVVVGEAIDGPSCLLRVEQLRPDILIMDYSMPGGGPQLTRAARELHPPMHILVFTGRDDARVKREMLSAGADQYILKTGRLPPRASRASPWRHLAP